MDQELQEAIATYKENIAALDALPVEEASTDEVTAMRLELQAALKDTQEALEAFNSAANDSRYNTSNEPVTNIPSTSVARRPNNTRIHPRSQYSHTEPNFQELSKLYPTLAPYIIPPAKSSSSSRPTIDFTDYNACRELTKVLLKHDFDISWWVPDGHLIPPVTNRCNYIHWLEDLLELSNPFKSLDPSSIKGLDIGCGANLIYPLLGAALNGWQFVGVDVTPEALEWAVKNREMNAQIAHLIRLRRCEMQQAQRDYLQQAATEENTDNAENTAILLQGVDVVKNPLGTGILSGAIQHGETFAFCMCNPPFFESIDEAGRNPNTAFAGTAIEMVYPGGELEFVTNIMEDSLSLPPNTVHWYTTMVGKKSTMKALRALLYRRGVKVVRTTEFFQGKTSRWAIAWSLAADPSVVHQPMKSTVDDTRRDSRAYAASTGQNQKESDNSEAANITSNTKKRKRSGTSRSLQIKARPNEALNILTTIEQALLASPCVARCDKDESLYTMSVSLKEAAGQGFPTEIKVFMQTAGLFGLTASVSKQAPDKIIQQFHDVFDDAVEVTIRSKFRVMV